VLGMNEMEFFAKFEIKPGGGHTSGQAVVIWRRNSGIYGMLREINGDFLAEVLSEHDGWKALGMRRTFHGALKLLREHPDLISCR
jgi:hypothetical protein